MWMSVLLQAIIGFWYLKIESGEEFSLSKFTHKNWGYFLQYFCRFYSRISLAFDISKRSKAERKSPFPNLRMKLGRLPPIWLPVLLQAIIGFWYFKIVRRKSPIPKIPCWHVSAMFNCTHNLSKVIQTSIHIRTLLRHKSNVVCSMLHQLITSMFDNVSCSMLQKKL